MIIDPVKAKGRKDLVDACPYGHIWWNEELQPPQRWPFDAHLLDQGWQQTRGHQSCPTGAMRAVKVEDDDMARIAREDRASRCCKPDLGTNPRVYYRNLWRYSTCFIGGTVSAEANGVVDCVEGATVRLLKDGSPRRRDRQATTTAISNSTVSTKIPAPTSSKSRPPATRRKQSRPRSASASISARSGCKSFPVALTSVLCSARPRASGDPEQKQDSGFPLSRE